MVSAASELDTLNYVVAMRSGKRDRLEKAMEEEISALRENEVWTVVNRAPGKNSLHTWVYKTKTDARDNLERLKAHLAAYGNEKVLGVNYTLNFASVTDLSTVKVILALASM